MRNTISIHKYLYIFFLMARDSSELIQGAVWNEITYLLVIWTKPVWGGWFSLKHGSMLKEGSREFMKFWACWTFRGTPVGYELNWQPNHGDKWYRRPQRKLWTTWYHVKIAWCMGEEHPHLKSVDINEIGNNINLKTPTIKDIWYWSQKII